MLNKCNTSSAAIGGSQRHQAAALSVSWPRSSGGNSMCGSARGVAGMLFGCLNVTNMLWRRNVAVSAAA